MSFHNTSGTGINNIKYNIQSVLNTIAELVSNGNTRMIIENTEDPYTCYMGIWRRNGEAILQVELFNSIAKEFFKSFNYHSHVAHPDMYTIDYYILELDKDKIQVLIPLQEGERIEYLQRIHPCTS